MQCIEQTEFVLKVITVFYYRTVLLNQIPITVALKLCRNIVLV